MKKVSRHGNNDPDQLKRSTFLMSKGIRTSAPVQLDLMFVIKETQRVIPNDFARAALFTACRGPRRIYNEFDTKGNPVFAEIFHLHTGVTIEYHGAELRAVDDELVLMQILCYASKIPMGEAVRFEIGQLVRDLGWPINGKYYDKARESITRMIFSKIRVRNEKSFGTSGIFPLIQSEITGNGADGEKTFYEVSVNPNMILFFAGNNFSRHKWDDYKLLSPVARRLADYIRSHRNPFPLTQSKFREMCGFKEPPKSESSWRRSVRDACAEVQALGMAKEVRLHTPNDLIYTTPADSAPASEAKD